MILEKLRQDFLDIFPSERFIRQSYIQHLQINQSEIFPIQSQSFLTSNYEHHPQHLEKLNWIPSPTILRTRENSFLQKSKYFFS